MTPLYEFHPQLLLRAPAQPTSPAPLAAATVWDSLHDPSFREALYLASPDLHQEATRWQRGELTDARKVNRLLGALTRYYLRAHNRCTPFGLFAGCGVVAWGPATRLALADQPPGRLTRLDMHYLCALARHLAAHPALRPHLRCQPNSTLYQLGDEFRYVEYQYEAGRRLNQLSAVAAAPGVAEALALAAPGPTVAALAAALAASSDIAEPTANAPTTAAGADPAEADCAGDVPGDGSADPTDADTDPAEAAQFVDALIDAQVLVTELEPNVTGEEFLDRLAGVLNRLAASPAPAAAPLARQLAAARQQLAALGAPGPHPVTRYQALAEALAPLGVDPEPGRLVQTDMLLPLAPAATLADAYQPVLRETLDALTRLTPAPAATRLDDFRRRFEARYETREVPLLHALDGESGLPYADYGRGSYSPLIHDLAVPAAPTAATALPDTPARQLLRRRLHQALREGTYAVRLTPAEVAALPAPARPLPASLAVLFRLLEAGEVLVESAGGPSAVNLLGRFAPAAPAIATMVQQVADHEQAQNPAVELAEICHLPASRVGNLLRRPAFRAAEIPYLAYSTLPAGQQVPAQDLLLAVHGGELVLRSRRTGRRIVPRLGTAHNFTHEALPVYQFLCDLQAQGTQPYLHAAWPAADDLPFRPRLSYGRAVLAPATWHLTAADLAELLALSPAGFAAGFRAFCQHWQLPRWFVLAEGDNELLVDTTSELTVQTWREAVRPLARVELRELLAPPTASPLRDAAGRPYAQQLVALLLRQGPSYQPVPGAIGEPAAAGFAATSGFTTAAEFAAPDLPAPGPAVQRDFGLGSEWLYYKLYGGPRAADAVLRQVVDPLVRELRARGLVDNWFFVRYADPEPHLRLRLHLPDPARLGEVLARAAAALALATAAGTVWNVQTDTYRRELERYGPATMAATEDLFGFQSDAALAWLAAQAEADEPEEPWLAGLAQADELLRAFAYPLPQRLALLQNLRDAFAREFDAGPALRRQLDARYRAHRPAIEARLAAAGAAPLPVPLRMLAARLGQLHADIAGPSAPAAPAGAELPPPPDHRLADYLHMLLNRLLPADARLHELVLYDFLARYYQSQLARAGRPTA